MKQKLYTARVKTSEELFGIEGIKEIAFSNGSYWIGKNQSKILTLKKSNDANYDYLEIDDMFTMKYKKEWLDDVREVVEGVVEKKTCKKPAKYRVYNRNQETEVICKECFEKIYLKRDSISVSKLSENDLKMRFTCMNLVESKPEPNYKDWIGKPVWAWNDDEQWKKKGILLEYLPQKEFPFTIEDLTEPVNSCDIKHIKRFKNCRLINHPGEIWEGWKDLK